VLCVNSHIHSRKEEGGTSLRIVGE